MVLTLRCTLSAYLYCPFMSAPPHHSACPAHLLGAAGRSEIAKRTNGLLDHYKKPHVNTASYQELYKESITKPDEFFDRMAKEHLSFDRPYKTILHGGFKDGDIAWFPEGGACGCAQAAKAATSSAHTDFSTYCPQA